MASSKLPLDEPCTRQLVSVHQRECRKRGESLIHRSPTNILASGGWDQEDRVDERAPPHARKVHSASQRQGRPFGTYSYYSQDRQLRSSAEDASIPLLGPSGYDRC